MKQTAIFLGGVVVGGLGFFMATGAVTPALPLPLAAEHASSTNSLPPLSGAVSVANQPAGTSAVVDSVTVPPPGVWVAIIELEPDGTLGNVLGAALVRGPRSNVSVPLLRSTLPNHHYAAVLYRDDGNGAFSLEADSAYVDFNTGARVVAPFSTLAH